jgi:hypothetical protein
MIDETPLGSRQVGICLLMSRAVHYGGNVMEGKPTAEMRSIQIDSHDFGGGHFAKRFMVACYSKRDAEVVRGLIPRSAVEDIAGQWFVVRVVGVARLADRRAESKVLAGIAKCSGVDFSDTVPQPKVAAG